MLFRISVRNSPSWLNKSLIIHKLAAPLAAGICTIMEGNVIQVNLTRS